MGCRMDITPPLPFPCNNRLAPVDRLRTNEKPGASTRFEKLYIWTTPVVASDSRLVPFHRANKTALSPLNGSPDNLRSTLP